MAKTRRRRLGALVATAALVLLARYVVRDTEGARPSHATAGPADARGGAPGTGAGAPSNDAAGTDPDAAFATHLRRRFGRTIAHGHTQVKALEALLAFLDRFHPGERDARAAALLREAFPDRAAELEEQLRRLDRYNAWLLESRRALGAMTPRDRRSALWDARREIFGRAAEEIWEVEARNARILDTVDAIGERPDAPLGEKLDQYLGAVREAYGDEAPAFVARRQTELLSQFLAIDTVQEDLHALEPEARRDALREMRHAMGMDEAAQARWSELDLARDQAWEVGARYMAERARLGEGAALTARQNELFGPEADIIRAEEASGFFRFASRRRIGRE